MNFGVPLPFITPGKFPATEITGEWLLAGVRTNVGCEVVTAAEVSHADATLEGLMSSMNSNMDGSARQTERTFGHILLPDTGMVAHVPGSYLACFGYFLGRSIGLSGKCWGL